MGRSDQLDEYVATVVSKYAKNKKTDVEEVEEMQVDEDKDQQVVMASTAAILSHPRPTYPFYPLPSWTSLANLGSHWLYTVNAHIVRSISLFGYGSCVDSLVREDNTLSSVVEKQRLPVDKKGIGYIVGQPFNVAKDGNWCWNLGVAVGGTHVPGQAERFWKAQFVRLKIEADAAFDQLTQQNTIINSNEAADESTAYLIKHGHQRTLVVQ
jgi:hypothetical protein